MIPISTQFGPYTLNWLIGRGGMGEVHNAFDTRHNRYVALKLLSREVSEDPGLRARFRREAQVVATLRHPHVIPVHGFGEIEGRLYLDMRLVEGSDLAAVLEAGALPPGRAVDIVEQVAGALEAAHDEGLVHRDVKPSNVLIARGSGTEEFAYLVDFGIARSVGSPTVTREDQPAGTLAYMAPERFRGARPAATGDIYALACLLYECLTGQRPFEAATLPDLLHAHLDQRPPKPSSNLPDLVAFDAVIAPYHDVGMTAIKVASFGGAVNVTLGLPFPRCSPDHGTALDIAGKGVADASSMIEAIVLCAQIVDRARSRTTEQR